jgi:CBS domain-containing protein
MNVDRLMSAPAVVCRQTDSLQTATQLMWDHDCGVVPVVDERGALVGMVTDRDACMSAHWCRASLDQVPVWNAMATKVRACHATDSLESAERLMAQHQVRRLPVVDDHGRPIGVLSLNDIARYAVASKMTDGHDHEVTETLAAIGAPRPPFGPFELAGRGGARPPRSPGEELTP